MLCDVNEEGYGSIGGWEHLKGKVTSVVPRDLGSWAIPESLGLEPLSRPRYSYDSY